MSLLGLTQKKSQTEYLKQQEFIFSQIWRLEVQDQGNIRVVFLWGLSPYFADDYPPAASLQGLFYVHACLLGLSVCPNFFFL